MLHMRGIGVLDGRWDIGTTALRRLVSLAFRVSERSLLGVFDALD
jgi:hypothetical protein